MKIKEIILSILSGIGALASAIFFVLFKQEKEYKLKDKIEELEEATQAQIQAAEIFKKQKEKADEKTNKICSGNHLSDVNAGLDLLRK